MGKYGGADPHGGAVKRHEIAHFISTLPCFDWKRLKAASFGRCCWRSRSIDHPAIEPPFPAISLKVVHHRNDHLRLNRKETHIARVGGPGRRRRGVRGRWGRSTPTGTCGAPSLESSVVSNRCLARAGSSIFGRQEIPHRRHLIDAIASLSHNVVITLGTAGHAVNYAGVTHWMCGALSVRIRDRQ